MRLKWVEILSAKENKTKDQKSNIKNLIINFKGQRIDQIQLTKTINDIEEKLVLIKVNTK